jgi:hypothetical protein
MTASAGSDTFHSGARSSRLLVRLIGDFTVIYPCHERSADADEDFCFHCPWSFMRPWKQALRVGGSGQVSNLVPQSVAVHKHVKRG